VPRKPIKLFIYMKTNFEAIGRGAAVNLTALLAIRDSQFFLAFCGERVTKRTGADFPADVYQSSRNMESVRAAQDELDVFTSDSFCPVI
jgi:hypothetical protein